MKKIFIFMILLFITSSSSFAVMNDIGIEVENEIEVEENLKNLLKIIEKYDDDSEENKKINKQLGKIKNNINIFLKNTNEIEKLEKIKNNIEEISEVYGLNLFKNYEIELYKIDGNFYNDKTLKQKYFLEILYKKITKKIIDLKVAEKLKNNWNKFLEIDKKISNIQRQIWNYWIKQVENIYKYTKLKQEWNFKILFQMGWKDFPKFLWWLKLDNYLYKKDFLDFQFKSDINWLFKDDNNKINYEYFVDLIMKEDAYYVLFKNININWLKWEKGEEMNNFITMTKLLLDWKTYIKIPSPTWMLYKEISKNYFFINEEKLKEKIKYLFAKRYFKVYKKVENKYIMTPTIELCNLVVDDFLDKEYNFETNTYFCAEKQYKKFLENYEKQWFEIYIENWKIWFSINETEIWNFKMENTILKEFKIDLSKIKNISKQLVDFNTLNIEYIKDKEFKIYSNFSNESFFNLNITDRKIKTSFILYMDNNWVSWRIDWKLSENWNIKDLDIKVRTIFKKSLYLKDDYNKNTLKDLLKILKKINKNINIKYISKEEDKKKMQKLDPEIIKILGDKYNPFPAILKISNIENYDYNTIDKWFLLSKIFDENFWDLKEEKKDFYDFSFNLKEKNINTNFKLFKKTWEEIFSSSGKWTYTDWKFDLDFVLKWVKIINSKAKIYLDIFWKNNNFKFSLDIKWEDENYSKMLIENTWTIEYTKQEIKAPDKYKNFEEIIPWLNY